MIYRIVGSGALDAGNNCGVHEGLVIDLGQSYFIGKVILQWKGSCGYGTYCPPPTIFISNDNLTWTPLPTDGGNGRYVKASTGSQTIYCAYNSTIYEGLYAMDLQFTMSPTSDPAQIDISGTVKDQFGNLMDGESLSFTVKDSIGTVVWSSEITSDAAGTFTEIVAMNNLPTGAYTLTVAADKKSQDIPVTVNTDGSVSWQGSQGSNTGSGSAMLWGLAIAGSALFFFIFSKDDKRKK